MMKREFLAAGVIAFLMMTLPATAYDEQKCAQANRKEDQAAYDLSTAEWYLDNCQWDGESSCSSEQYNVDQARYYHDNMVSEQWYYCY